MSATKLSGPPPCSPTSRNADGYGDFQFAPNPCDEDDFEDVPSVITQELGHDLRQLFDDDAITDEPEPEEVIVPGFRFLDLPKDVRDIMFAKFIAPFRDEDRGGLIAMEIEPCAYGCHPFRNQYELTIVQDGLQQNNTYSDTQSHLSLEDYNRLWSLSNVSHGFREELAAAFWKNIHFNITYVIPPFLRFVTERSNAAKGIRYLKLRWHHFDYLLESFATDCENLSHHVDLDEFEFRLTMSPHEARNLIDTNGRAKWIHAFRSIKMKRLKFRLILEGQVLTSFPEEADEATNDDSSSHGEEVSTNLNVTEEVSNRVEGSDATDTTMLSHHENENVSNPSVNHEGFTDQTTINAIANKPNELHQSEPEDDWEDEDEDDEYDEYDDDDDDDDEFDEIGLDSHYLAYGPQGFDDYGSMGDFDEYEDDDEYDTEETDDSSRTLADELEPQIAALLRPPPKKPTVKEEYLQSRIVDKELETSDVE